MPVLRLPLPTIQRSDLDFDNDMVVVYDDSAIQIKKTDVREFLSVSNWFNAENYGVVFDDSTDNSSALTTLAGLLSAGDVVYFPPGGKARSSTTFSVPNGVGVVMHSPLVCTASHDRYALQIGTSGDSVVNDMAGMPLELWAEYLTVGAWSGVSHGCIDIRNMRHGHCLIRRTSGGAVGVRCLGDGGGVVYNRIIMIEGEDHARHFYVDTTTGTSTKGWYNQNYVQAVKFRNNSSVNSGVKRWGYYIGSSDGTVTSNNGNLFVGGGFELNPPGGAGTTEAYPIYIESLHESRFEQLRNESLTALSGLVECGDNVENVTVDIVKDETGPGGSADTPATVVYTGDTQFGVLVSEQGDYGTSWINAFDSGPLIDQYSDYDGAGAVAVRGFGMYRSSPLHPSANTAGISETSITVGADYLEAPSSRGFGLRVRFLSGQKQVRIRRDADGVYTGRLYIRCFDSGGNVIDNTGDLPVAMLQTTTWTTSYGGAFRTNADDADISMLSFGDPVSYVDLIFTGGSPNTLRLKRVWIDLLQSTDTYVEAPDVASTWNGAPGRIATAAPSVGTWAVGERIYHAMPGATGTVEWVCTTAGTPGIWRALT